MITKLCYGCKINLPIENFPNKGNEPGRPPRLDSRCKPCKKSYMSKYFKDKLEAKRALLPPKHKSPEGHKQCSHCNLDQPISIFRKNIKAKDGLEYRCNPCIAIYKNKKLELKNVNKPSKLPSNLKKCNTCSLVKELVEFRTVKNNRSDKLKLYYQCKCCERELGSKKRQQNPEKYRAINLKCRNKNKDRINANARAKYQENIEENRKKAKEKTKNPGYKESVNSWRKKKLESDPLFKLSCALRHRTFTAIRDGKYTKNLSLFEYLGCSMDEFKSYLESQFQPGMTWDNYGRGPTKWSLDHTVPLKIAKTESEIYSLNHHTNIRPMWYTYNLIKNSKTPAEWSAYKLAHNIDESLPPWSVSPPNKA